MPLLIALAALAPFSLHVVAPSVPGIGRAFGEDFATAQLVLTAYLAAVALGQLVYGPIADFYGRRPLLITGLCVYCLGSVACAVASSIDTLIAARAVQALGACSGLVLGRAMVSDLFARDTAASRLGSMAAGMAIATAVAPTVGAYLDQDIDWRATFLALAAGGGTAALLSLKFAHETLAHRPASMEISGFLKDCANVLSARRYIAYAAHLALTTAAWFAFVAGMPFYMSDVLGRPLHEYGLYIVPAFAGYILGNCAAARLAVRLGTPRMIAWGAAISTVGFLAMALAPSVGLDGPLALFAAISVAVVGQGITVPGVMAAALNLNPRIVGTASSLLGAIQMAVSAGATFLVGQVQGGSVETLVHVVAGAGLLSVLVLVLFRSGPADRMAVARGAMPATRGGAAHTPGGRRYPPRPTSIARAMRKARGSSNRRTIT
jgi:MFS transporter, DHA1 family, multidrug resistance protein